MPIRSHPASPDSRRRWLPGRRDASCWIASRSSSESGQASPSRALSRVAPSARRIEDFLAAGYAVRINYLWLDDPDLAVRRVKQRARSGGHDVPEPDIRRRFWRSIRNFEDRYASRATSWRLCDSSVASTPRVARRRQGKNVTILDEERWREFKAFVETAHRKGEDQNDDRER